MWWGSSFFSKPKSACDSRTSCFSNSVPWSECKLSGTSNTENTRPTRTRATVAAAALLRMRARIPKRVKWSMADVTYLQSWDSTISYQYSTRSIGYSLKRSFHWHTSEYDISARARSSTTLTGFTTGAVSLNVALYGGSAVTVAKLVQTLLWKLTVRQTREGRDRLSLQVSVVFSGLPGGLGKSYACASDLARMTCMERD